MMNLSSFAVIVSAVTCENGNLLNRKICYIRIIACLINIFSMYSGNFKISRQHFFEIR